MVWWFVAGGAVVLAFVVRAEIAKNRRGGGTYIDNSFNWHSHSQLGRDDDNRSGGGFWSGNDSSGGSGSDSGSSSDSGGGGGDSGGGDSGGGSSD